MQRTDTGPGVRTSSGRAAAVVLALAVLLGSGCAASEPADDAVPSQAAQATTTEIADPAAVRDAVEDGAELIDVRTPAEFADGHLRGAVNVDLSAPDFEQRIADLEESGSYVVYCESGRRAGEAITIMREQGFDDLVNGGGFDDLAEAGLPTSP